MSENKLTKLLKSFDENQLREINAFLSSARGQKLKSALSEADKERLIQEFGRLDPESARRRIKGMSKAELSAIINKLGG